MLISDLSSEQLLMLIVPALPNMWALKHAMYHDFPTPKEKYRWMMACVFIPCLGGIAYYFVGRKHASKEKVDIRARMEAEQARKAAEKAGAEGSVSSEAVAVEPAAQEAVTLSGPVAAQDSGKDRPAVEGASARGGDWSFGCPDDVRKP